MKTHYKYMYFSPAPDCFYKKRQKTKVWFCYNNKTLARLGLIKWFSKWRQFCFFSESNIVLSIGCMEDIIHFTNQVKEDYNEREKR